MSCKVCSTAFCGPPSKARMETGCPSGSPLDDRWLLWCGRSCLFGLAGHPFAGDVTMLSSVSTTAHPAPPMSVSDSDVLQSHGEPSFPRGLFVFSIQIYVILHPPTIPQPLLYSISTHTPFRNFFQGKVQGAFSIYTLISPPNLPLTFFTKHLELSVHL